jgi:hypothetical protein
LVEKTIEPEKSSSTRKYNFQGIPQNSFLNRGRNHLEEISSIIVTKYQDRLIGCKCNKILVLLMSRHCAFEVNV